MAKLTLCRYCGRPIVFAASAFNKRAQRRVQGNPVMVFHPDGLPCCGPGNQLNFDF